MRAQEFLAEVFAPNSGYELEWDDQFGPKEIHARAYDRQGQYIDINFVPVRDNVTDIEFSKMDNYEATGEGDEIAIFSTVLKAIRKYLQGYQPKIIVFSGKGENRGSLYQKMITRYASQLGYKQFDLNKLSPEARQQIAASNTNAFVLRKASPVSETVLTERATSEVYHYTNSQNALRTLKDGAFKLSNTAGNKSEQQYAPAGYPYFMSTTRSKVGDYHRYVGSSAVMFVLNGDWLSARYPVKPVDYWERSWQGNPGRTREAEDRVFSKTNEISIDCVTAVHVLITEQHETRSAVTRGILISAKTKGIPAYLYTDATAWRLQNINKAVSPSEIADVLKGQEPSGWFKRPVRGVKGYGRSSLLDWIELIKKQPGQPLSSSADKLRQNISYYSDTFKVLDNDLFNAKKPDGNEYAVGVKLGDYMNRHKLDPKGLEQMLKDKWNPPKK